MKTEEVELMRKKIQGLRAILTDGVGKSFMILSGTSCREIYSTLGNMLMFMDEQTKYTDDQLDAIRMGIDNFLNFKDKTLIFPRLSGRTAEQLNQIMHTINSGKETVVISKGKTTSFIPVVHCKDCKWRNTKACFCKSIEDVKDDWFCSEGKRR